MVSWLIPTFSPQGDGNCHHRQRWVKFTRRVDPYLFPARGRKHENLGVLFRGRLLTLIPTFSPQGDGNSTALLEDYPVPTKVVDPYLFPARGRKPNPGNTGLRQISTLIPTFSPQGDGNLKPGMYWYWTTVFR